MSGSQRGSSCSTRRRSSPGAYNDMSLAISEDKEDPEDAAEDFLDSSNLA